MPPRVLDQRRQLRPGVLHVADGLADRPDFERVVGARFQQREQFIIGCRLLAEPLRPIALGKYDRHAISKPAGHTS